MSNQQIIENPKWALSSEGNPISLYTCRTKNPQKLLFIGGVHGDEPEGVLIATSFLDWLRKNHKDEFYSWMMIPCLNVDGYKRDERTNGRGVDLNRNFPTSDWSSESKGPRYFPGPHPNSESEVQALVQLIEKEKPLLIVHFHSWEPCVVYTGDPGKTWAEKMATGTPYKAGPDIGYPTPGSLGQFGWLMHKIPVICLEAEDRKYNPNSMQIAWPTFGPGLQSILIPS